MSASSVNVRGLGDYPFATKKVGTTHYQKIALDLGDDNTAQLLTSGQKTMALSVPVVIASDQSVISIDLSTVGGDGMSLGQKVAAAAITVVPASDMNPTESWFDDFSSQRWGNVMMGVEANLSSHPVAVDSIGNLIVANATNSATTALTDARGKIDGPSITNTYSTLLSMSGAARHLALWNSTDQNLLITYDNGTTDNVELDAGEFYSVDFIALGTRLAASTIKVKWLTAVPKFGSVRAVIIR